MHVNRSDPETIRNSGNALWLVLLAISLLVALTITITRTSQTTEETGGRERNRIMAAEILRQAKGMEHAIEKMRMDGLSENDISFENTYVNGYASASCAFGDRCKVFSAAGGGTTYKSPQQAWLDESQSSETAPVYGQWYVYATSCVPGIGTGGSACNGSESHTELILGLPWIREDLCVEINRLTGVPNGTSPIAPPSVAGAAYDPSAEKFTGSYIASGIIDNADGDFTHRQSGCFKGNSADPDGGHHFYHVLIPR